MENLVKTLKGVLELANKTAKALDDGKINIFEAIGLTPDAIKVIVLAVKNGDELAEELGGMDEHQFEELVQMIKADFDIADDDIEMKIEAVIDWIFCTYKTIQIFTK